MLTADAPPKEDSQDLADEEIASSLVSTSVKELADLLAKDREAGRVPVRYELRRRGQHVYIRVRRADDNPLLIQVDWLDG